MRSRMLWASDCRHCWCSECDGCVRHGRTADPTASNFMPEFDALDADAQAIVLKNADPLDLTSMIQRYG